MTPKLRKTPSCCRAHTELLFQSSNVASCPGLSRLKLSQVNAVRPATSRELHLAGDSGSYTAGLSTDLPTGPCPPPLLPISVKALRRRRLWTRILHVFLPDSCPASPSVRGGGAVSVCISPESTRHQPPWPKIISKWLGHRAPGGTIREQTAPACTQLPSRTAGQSSGTSGACWDARWGGTGTALLWGISLQRGEEGSPAAAPGASPV